jgi:hypothetical protein
MATEKNIEQLLKKLSADKKPYPKNLLDARRASYLSQVSLVTGSGLHLKKGNGPGQGGSSTVSAPMTPLMKVILGTLIAANIALATYLGISIYENWDKVQELLLGGTSTSEISPISPEMQEQSPEVETTPEIAVPPVETAAPVSTPEPVNLSDENQSSEGDSANNPQVDSSKSEISTQEPEGSDDSGKHLGQTPHAPDNPPANQDSQNDNQNKNNSSNQGKDKNK